MLLLRVVGLGKNRTGSQKAQKQTAETPGMQLRSYQFYKEGKAEPSIKKILLLADFFDVTTDYLLGQTGKG